MRIIKNSKDLAKLVDENKDLFLKEEDVRIEFSPTEEELRDVYCRDLFLMNDDQKFDFNGRDFNGWNFYGLDFNGCNFNGWDFNGCNFNGWDFNGWNFYGCDFNGWDFNGRDFNGRDFYGRDFNGRDFYGRNFYGCNFNGWGFNGKKVSYGAFFNCYGSMKCESYEGRRQPHSEPICLDGRIEIIKPEEPKSGKTVKIKVKDGSVLESEIVED